MPTFYDATVDILRQVYDETTKRLRVDTELTLTGNVIIERVKIEDPCSGVQTNDIKITLDGEEVKVSNLPNEGTPKHYNGSVGTFPETITLYGHTRSIFIENVNFGKELYISFDGGSNWKRIRSNSGISLDCRINSLDLKGSSSNTGYEILTVE